MPSPKIAATETLTRCGYKTPSSEPAINRWYFHPAWEVKWDRFRFLIREGDMLAWIFGQHDLHTSLLKRTTPDERTRRNLAHHAQKLEVSLTGAALSATTCREQLLLASWQPSAPGPYPVSPSTRLLDLTLDLRTNRIAAFTRGPRVTTTTALARPKLTQEQALKLVAPFLPGTGATAKLSYLASARPLTPEEIRRELAPQHTLPIPPLPKTSLSLRLAWFVTQGWGEVAVDAQTGAVLAVSYCGPRG